MRNITHLLITGLLLMAYVKMVCQARHYLNQSSRFRQSKHVENPKAKPGSQRTLKKISKLVNDEDCERPPPIVPPRIDPDKLTLWELMEKSEQDLLIHDGKGVLIVGHSGSGKTTVALTITGSLSDLTVYETEGESLLILDANQTIGMKTISRTLVPQLIYDPTSDIFLYDFPQFRESRPNVDITGKYLMRKVTDNLASVRIILTVSEDSVSGGGAKGDFGSLITTLAEMIQNTKNFKQGIGMIVTKITNYNSRGKFREDEAVMKGIVAFLEQYKEEEEEKLTGLRSGLMSHRNKKLSKSAKKSTRRSHSPFLNFSRKSVTENKKTIKNKIRLIDTLLQDNRIAIFRSPDTCGSFDLSTWSKENKEGMTRLISDELEWVPINKTDINYTVSSDSIVKLDNLYKELNSNVSQIVTQMVTTLRKTLAASTLEIYDYFAINASVHADYGNFTGIVEIGAASKSPEFIGRTVQSAIDARGYEQSLGLEFHSKMAVIGSRMDFFDSIAPSGLTYERLPENWLKSWESWVTEEVEGRKEWYEFLWSLRNALSSFEFQAQVPDSVPTDILGIKTALGELGDIVTDKVIKYYENVHIVEKDKEILFEIVNEGFEKTNVSCNSESPPMMTVTGTVVKVTDFTSKSDGRPNLCNGKPPSRVVVYATRKFLVDGTLYPQKGLTWDAEVSIVSPEWDVSTSKDFSIILNGETGSDGSASARKHPAQKSSKKDYYMYAKHKPSTISKRRRWDIVSEQAVKNFTHRSKRAPTHSSIPDYRRLIDETCQAGKDLSNGKRGNDGAPGKPGQTGYPAGSFIGLSYSMENVHKVVIYVNGGSGGKGRNGAPGTNGGDGDASHSWYMLLLYNKQDYPPCRGECSTVEEKCSGSWATTEFYYCYRYSENFIYCRMDWCDGGEGGNGGDGGAGGRGAAKGSAVLITAHASQNITVKRTDGANGQNGDGGTGGSGGLKGKNENHYVTEASSDNCAGYFGHMADLDALDLIPKRAASGSKGRNGANKDGQKELRQPSYKLTPAAVYFSYREYALSKPLVYFSQKEFIDFLDTSPGFLGTFSPMHFAQELLSLEEAHLLLKIQQVERDSVALRMIPQYQSLLIRINKFINVTGNQPDTSRKFLSLLYSLALNQLRILKQVTGTPLVVDVQGYLKAVQDRLDVYDNIKDHVDRKNLVDTERIRYKQIFFERIEETVKIIATRIDPVVKEIDASIGEVTRKLEDAIDDMIRDSERAEAAYREAKDKAKKQLEATLVSTPLSNSASLVNLLGAPAINIIAQTVETIDLNGGSLSLGNDDEIRPPTPLPASIKKYADLAEADLKTLSKHRKNEINVLIEESRKAAKKAKEALEESKTRKSVGTAFGWFDDLVSSVVEVITDIVDAVVDAATEVYEAVATSLPMKIFDYFMNLIGSNQDALFCTIEGFKEDAEGEDVDLARLITSILDNLGDIMKVAGISGPLAEKLKDDQENLKRVTAMLEEAQGQTKDLKNYKQNVKALAGPFTKSIIDEMEDAKQKMANGSAVSLRVQKWEISGTLRDLSTFLRDISQAFPEIANEYGQLVIKLQEGMDVLIELYAMINQYTDQMQFADYIANLHTPKAQGIRLGTEETKIYEKINLALLGSMILSEWDTTVQNFDQWVFPFSNEFQRSFASKRIPDYLSKDITNTSALLQELIPEIRIWVKDLDIELQKYRSSVFPEIDDQLINATFGSEYQSAIPFHVWKCEEHQETIKSLLSGEQVTFSISPEYTYTHGMSAVKFNVANIQPKLRNKTIESEFEYLLNELRVELSHSGISRYQYEDNNFQMVGSRQMLQYNFERDTNGERLHRNEVYIKIQNGDPIISPYTIWTAQLFRANPKVTFNWKHFAKFSKFVDIELIGEGTFVRRKEQSRIKSSSRPKHSDRRQKSQQSQSKTKKNNQPLHYYRFKMSSFPTLSKNSVLNNILSQI